MGISLAATPTEKAHSKDSGTFLWTRAQLAHSTNNQSSKSSEANSAAIQQIIYHLDRVLCDIDDRGLSNVVYSLGTMELAASALPRPTLTLLLDKLGVMLPHLTAQGVSNLLYGLGLMGLEYSRIPAAVQQGLQEKLVHTLGPLTADSARPDSPVSPRISSHQSGLTPQGYANIIYALGLMRTPVHLLQVSLQSHILAAQCVYMQHLGEIGIGASMMGLAGMGVKWFDWEESQVKKLEGFLASKVGSLNARGLSNICFA